MNTFNSAMFSLGVVSFSIWPFGGDKVNPTLCHDATYFLAHEKACVKVIGKEVKEVAKAVEAAKAKTGGKK